MPRDLPRGTIEELTKAGWKITADVLHSLESKDDSWFLNAWLKYKSFMFVLVGQFLVDAFLAAKTSYNMLINIFKNVWDRNIEI
jgi:hypothetical protein